MGFFSNLFRKKNESNVSYVRNSFDSFIGQVSNHFNNIRDDMQLQKRWVDYLHNLSLKLQSQHDDHKSLTQKDIDSLKSWVNHLYSSQKAQENDIKAMENSVEQAISAMTDALSAMSSRIEMLENDHKVKHARVVGDVNQMLLKHHDKTKEKLSAIMSHVQDIKVQPTQMIQAPQPTQVIQHSPLTNPERKLLNLLLSQPDPISYSKIAGMTGQSINTVRVVMNSLKKKDVIEENTLPSGEKLFSAKNEEKVKKVYNIEHI